jgi:hypothetical protein
MSLSSDLKKAYSVANLRKAWQRLLTNTELEYKNYFRDLYKAYALSLDENIADLHKRLVDELYTVEHSIKVYTPKKTGLLRTFTLLGLEDQIVYQAYANVVADYLHPKAFKNYNKINFGNYYAGQSSIFFYKKWQLGYQAFSASVRKVYTSGLAYSASFDYTAFYDTIDHSVLSRLMEDLGLSKEFVLALTGYLRIWTCTDLSRKYHGHGIPQGPISSAMLAEVLMTYVDDCFGKESLPVKYLRYADDIRLMSVDELGVRKGVLSLDLISKRLGLFPQAGKVGIHHISDISNEIKNISAPDIYSEDGKEFSWLIVGNYIKNGKIIDETKFKYLLSRTEPNSILEARCLRLLEKYPHLYIAILNYINKRQVLTSGVSKKLLSYVKENGLYEEVVAKCLNIAYEKVGVSYRQDYIDFCLSYFVKINESISPNLKAQIIKWVLRESQVKYSDLLYIIESSESWVVHNILASIGQDTYGSASYSVLLNDLLCSEDKEVSLSAACLCVENGIQIMADHHVISAIAQRPLKKANKIPSLIKKGGTFTNSLRNIFGVDFGECNWDKFLLQHAKAMEKQLFLCRSFVQTDITVFFNKMSIINELVIEHIFRIDATLPSYKPGNFGGYINSRSSEIAKKHWDFYLMCETVQSIRRNSDLAHAVNKYTKKPTSRVLFAEFRKNKSVLINGYVYLIEFIKKHVPVPRNRRKSLVNYKQLLLQKSS